MRLSIDLPKNKQDILDTLLDRLEVEFADDIAIVACYGSYVTGTPTPVSDVDFYFIPNTPKGYQMSWQFIVDDIGYDLWPLSWERAERIAGFDESLVSIIADASVVYYRGPRDMKRFDSLKDTVRELMKPEKKALLLRKAQAMLGEAKKLFFDACANGRDPRHIPLCSSSILEEALAALAFANSTYVNKGAVRVDDEISRFAVVPEGFIDRYHAVLDGGDQQAVLQALQALVRGVDMVISEAQRDEEEAISDRAATGFYEELKSTYNKVYNACNKQALEEAFFAVNAVVREVRGLFGSSYDAHGFADLHTPLSERNYELLRERANEHEGMLVNILKSHGVSIKQFSNIDEFRGRVI